jgi:hypothetical protein
LLALSLKANTRKAILGEGDLCIFISNTLLIISKKFNNQSPSIYSGTRYSKLRTQRHAARFGYNQEIDKKHQGKQVKERK